MAKAEITAVKEAVQEAGGFKQPQLTKKQTEKQQKRMKDYWNGMITRREAYEMVNEALLNEQKKSALLLIQIKTLTQFLVDKGMTTLEELDELSKPIVDEIYGKKEKEEGTEQPMEEPEQYQAETSDSVPSDWGTGNH